MPHVPVLRERIVALLAPGLNAPPGDPVDRAVVVDCTVGLGGHAAALLEALPEARLVGLDRDPEALRHSAARLEPYRERVTLVHAVYSEITEVLADLGLATVAGVLFDLGVSSLQLDEVARGFSYAQDAPLDMRMDPAGPLTAADVVNGYPRDELARVLRSYGEERFAGRIAAAIARERLRTPLRSSQRLVEIIRAAVPAPAQRSGGHPAKRVFQALRIEVNGELEALRQALPAAVGALAVGGRMAVLAYQSLEDRLVKQTFAGETTVSAPPDFPVVPEQAMPRLRLLTRGAERPDAAEVAANPRAASARLRAVERLRAAA